MRKLLAILIGLSSVIVISAALSGCGGSSQPNTTTDVPAAASTPAKAPAPATPTPVKVVMRDPGCHWFAVGGKFKMNMAVSGMAKLSNFDEAALRIRSAGSVKRVNVGRTGTLGPGAYTITMVGQKPDDNTLHLTVR